MDQKALQGLPLNQSKDPVMTTTFRAIQVSNIIPSDPDLHQVSRRDIQKCLV